MPYAAIILGTLGLAILATAAGARVLEGTSVSDAARTVIVSGIYFLVYAVMFEGRQGPWENGAWSGVGGIFKSTDGGSTWKELKNGLPDRIGNAELLREVLAGVDIGG